MQQKNGGPQVYDQTVAVKLIITPKKSKIDTSTLRPRSNDQNTNSASKNPTTNKQKRINQSETRA